MLDFIRKIIKILFMANPKTILIEFLSFHHVLPGKIFSIGFSNQLFLT